MMSPSSLELLSASIALSKRLRFLRERAKTVGEVRSSFRGAQTLTKLFRSCMEFSLLGTEETLELLPVEL